MSRITPHIAMAIALTATALFAGCESTNKQRAPGTPYADSDGRWHRVPDAEPAPMAAAPAKPAASTQATRSTSGDGMITSEMFYPTGDRATSGLWIQKIVPAEVRAGQPFDYFIKATNLTNNKLTDVVVSDAFGQNFKFNSAEPQPTSMQGGNARWALGTLDGKESKTIKVNGSSTGAGAITSCAEVAYSSMLCSTINVVEPKLVLTKTGPADVIRCDAITYTLEVANTGTGSIHNVKISDPLPAGLISGDGKRTVEFNVGTLAAGQKRQFPVTVQAEKAGKYENKATASADGGMTVDSALVATTVREPVLKITKTGDKSAFIGDQFTYQISVTNSGDAPCRDTIIEDTLPAGVNFVSATEGGRMVGNKVTWNVGTLSPNASKNVSVTLNSATANVVKNTATARGYCAAAVTANADTEVTGIPAILLECVDLKDPIRVGEETVYVISVTNQGTALDRNIKIVVEFDDEHQYVSSTGPTTATAAGQTLTFATLASLAPKAKVEYRVTVKGVKAGDSRIKIILTSESTPKSPVEETESTRVY